MKCDFQTLSMVNSTFHPFDTRQRCMLCVPLIHCFEPRNTFDPPQSPMNSDLDLPHAKTDSPRWRD